MASLFGTDGIRARANSEDFRPDEILSVGLAAAQIAGEFIDPNDKAGRRPRVVIGKDTRLSGYMVESAITAGLVSGGAFPILLGPMPTPAVSMLTNSLRADLGVMITASHNLYEDNGIKFFAPDGKKLNDEVSERLSEIAQKPTPQCYAEPHAIGQVTRLDDAYGRYIEAVKQTIPPELRLDGLKVVLDCANGAAYKVAPEILWELGAEVIAVGNNPDGLNINKNCGATDTRMLRSEVISKRADIGIALDGDGDRVFVCDELGQEADGDQILALIAKHWKRDGRLKSDIVVATVMSNMGLERYLNTLGIALTRTKVGDRFVFQEMEERDINLGGEQSGHVILSDFASTGDGLIAALQVLSIVKKERRRASEVLRVFEPLPQLTNSVKFAGPSPLQDQNVASIIQEAEMRLDNCGRLLVRESGTEPVVRVMVECDNKEILHNVHLDVSNAIKEAA